jgi:Na+/melibiose symporter-like transporter
VSIDDKRALVVGLFALSSLLAVVGHNAWLAWMGELVPARIRGAYFGRRTALSAVVATVTSLVVASALDAGRTHAALDVALSGIVVLRSIAGIATTVLMLRQHDPPSPTVVPAVADFLRPIADRAYRKLLAYRAAWGIATGLAASLSAVYVLRALGLGFTGIALYSAAVASLRVVTTPLWGRLLDRAGGRHVLVTSSIGVALSSLTWVFATRGCSWLIIVDALASGLLLGGQELAVFTLPLACSPRSRRALYAATSVMVGGLAYGGASVVAGALASVVSLRAILLAAALWRGAATLVAIVVDDGRPRCGARPRHY